MAGRALRMRARFAVVPAVIAPVVLLLTVVGVHGLWLLRGEADALYRDHLLTMRTTMSLDIAIEDAQQAALEQLLTTDPSTQRHIVAQRAALSVDIENGLVELRAHADDDPAERPLAQNVASYWHLFETAIPSTASRPSTAGGVRLIADQVRTDLDNATAAAKQVIAIEATQAAAAHRQAVSTYLSAVTLLYAFGGFTLVLTLAVMMWLTRGVLPRTLAYAEFAAKVGRGAQTARLEPQGTDELAELGSALNGLAERQHREEMYDRAHLHLIDSLQLAETEHEAYELLKRHLQRSITDSEVTVLNRNNSADRLQPVTRIEAGNPLQQGLDSAKPRSCLAIRKARPHLVGQTDEELLGCSVCSSCPGNTTCTPLIVGGEVIGSVLANHPRTLSDIEDQALRESVLQAAPVMGNLRNLAIAERRAATDSLTGLPNKRAMQDALRRTVAHASRTVSPVAALMCDLDHFKHINDQYGHSFGDDILAAVGAALADNIRASDVAARYGGEEFLVLLPDTDPDGAVVLADKIRSAVTGIRLPTLEQDITFSIGIAGYPHHALDADNLVRAADRALYAAKNAGRDRVEVFTSDRAPMVSLPAAP